MKYTLFILFVLILFDDNAFKPRLEILSYRSACSKYDDLSYVRVTVRMLSSPAFRYAVEVRPSTYPLPGEDGLRVGLHEFEARQRQGPGAA